MPIRRCRAEAGEVPDALTCLQIWLRKATERPRTSAVPSPRIDSPTPIDSNDRTPARPVATLADSSASASWPVPESRSRWLTTGRATAGCDFRIYCQQVAPSGHYVGDDTRVTRPAAVPRVG